MQQYGSDWQARVLLPRGDAGKPEVPLSYLGCFAPNVDGPQTDAGAPSPSMGSALHR